MPEYRHYPATGSTVFCTNAWLSHHCAREQLSLLTTLPGSGSPSELSAVLERTVTEAYSDTAQAGPTGPGALPCAAAGSRCQYLQRGSTVG